MTKTIHIAAATLLVFTATAAAQTTTPPPVVSPSASPGPGSYDTLSVGNQKIALALFKAQVQPTPPPGVAPPSSPTPLTLDEIATLKRSGTGWGQVFKQMKAQGLVTEKNLGQVVSRYNHASHSSGAAVSAANRPSGNTVASGEDGAHAGDPGNDKSMFSRGNGGPAATSAGSSMSSGRGNAAGSGGSSGNSGRGNGHLK
jgi:hypothetical protein